MIQKTHYEILKELINEKRVLLSQDFDQFVKSTGTICGDNPNFEQFAQSPIIVELAHIAESVQIQKAQQQVATLANILYHAYCLYAQHERIYYISPGLAVNLAQTDLNIDTHFLRSPFPEIYIQIDPGLYHIVDSETPEVKSPVRGFYVNLREEGDVKWVRIMVAALSSSYAKISQANDDAIFYFKIPIGPGKVQDQVKAYTEKIKVEKLGEIKKYDGILNFDYMEDLFYFVFNVLLYITSKDPDIVRQLPIDYAKKIEGLKNKAKIRKMEHRQSRECALPVILVGPSIKSRYDAEQIKSAGGIGAWKLQNRIYVSGHWRGQWYGSEKEGTRRKDHIFIGPYEKGPDLGDIVSRQYQVGKS